MAFLLVLVGAAAQGLTPTDQDRHVSASNVIQTTEGTFPFQETVSAPDLLPFSAAIDGFTPPLAGPSIASQGSQILGGSLDRLSAAGFAVANPEESLDAVHNQDSESVYRVDFDLDAPRYFDLNGTLDLYAFNCEASTVGHVRLTGPGGVVFEAADEIITGYVTLVYCEPACEVSLPVEGSGLLPAGSYRLEAVVQSYGQGLSGPGDVCDAPYSRGEYAVGLTLLDPRVPALPLPAAAFGALALAAAARRPLRGRTAARRTNAASPRIFV